MKAVRLVTAGEPLVLEDVAQPKPGDDEVLVKVAGCGVCHTDIGFWKDGVPTKKGLPLTLGHEVSGTVVQAGSRYKQLLDREVIVPAVIPCGECELCRAGERRICRAQIMPGNDRHGGFASHVAVPARFRHHKPVTKGQPQRPTFLCHSQVRGCKWRLHHGMHLKAIR